jgi:uncharacterized protein (DUF362 family)
MARLGHALIVHPRVLVARNRTPAEGRVAVVEALELAGDESRVGRFIDGAHRVFLLPNFY